MIILSITRIKNTIEQYEKFNLTAAITNHVLYTVEKDSDATAEGTQVATPDTEHIIKEKPKKMPPGTPRRHC